MSKELRRVKITSGKYEVEMEVTQEQYSSYMRPWWEMKQRAKRNRDAMEAKGYSLQSYEEWQDANLSTGGDMNSMEETIIHQEMLESLTEALKSLTEYEKEIAISILTGDMSTAEFARVKGMKRTTVSDKKRIVLEKLKKYFQKMGYDI